MRPFTLAFALCLAAAPVLAEDTNPAQITSPEVKARVELMLDFKAQAKVLADAASGAQPFDAGAVEAAIAGLQTGAAQLAPLFRPRADDPLSQALPEIWTSASEFRQKTAKLVKTTGALDAGDPGALAETLKPVMAACKDCHGRFKM